MNYPTKIIAGLGLSAATTKILISQGILTWALVEHSRAGFIIYHLFKAGGMLMGGHR